MRYFDNTNPRKNRKITHFADEITIVIGGKKQNIRKMIAKASEDTGIYEQIEKYGIDVNTQPSIEETVMDFTAIKGDLRTAIERGMAAKEMFKRLPIDVRKEFNNDENLFMEQGVDWMNKVHQQIIEKQKAAQQAAQQTAQQQSTTKEGE